eukprot:7868013-Alexandrium_andersonii.AAC.1
MEVDLVPFPGRSQGASLVARLSCPLKPPIPDSMHANRAHVVAPCGEGSPGLSLDTCPLWNTAKALYHNTEA